MGCEAREGSSHRALIGVNTYPVHCDSVSTPPSSLTRAPNHFRNRKLTKRQCL